MVFSTKYLKTFFGTQNIEKSMTKHFWQMVSEDYGGFWRFSVSEDENQTGKIVVSDLLLDEDDSFMIKTKKFYDLSNSSI